MYDAKFENKEKDPLKYSCLAEKGYFKGLKCDHCLNAYRSSFSTNYEIKMD